MSQQPCPLCTNKSDLWLSLAVDFYRCPNCCLIAKDYQHHLPPEMEKQRYSHHNNDPADKNYRDFLDRLLLPLEQHIAAKSSGLDFGSGPTKVTEQILLSRGYQVDSFDPYFFPDEALQEKRYDFIIASEVFEHLFKPAKELELLDSILNVGGVLAVMTSTYPTQDEFERWYYWKDPTHVVFYSDTTFNWISKKMNWLILQRLQNRFYLKKLARS